MKPYFETELGKLYHGSCRETLKQMPDETIDCVMTSPPYWALRDYGIDPEIWDSDEDCEHEFNIEIIKEQTKISNKTGLHNDGRKNPITEKYRETLDSMTLNEYKRGFCLKCGAWKGSLGLEPTFQLYIQHLIQIFDEIKRVLKKTGTCWVNIGDTYGSGRGEKGEIYPGQTQQSMQWKSRKAIVGYDKCLLQIPERFSIAMTDNGWIKRNTIIWEKPNCMPSSADDRFTVDYEYLYFFVKNQKYWFEQQFEKLITKPHVPGNKFHKDKVSGPMSRGGHSQWEERMDKVWGSGKGRNKRCVWKPTFQDWVEHCTTIWNIAEKMTDVWRIPTQPFPEAHFAVYPEKLCYTPIKAGCPENGTVLDPFTGAGTTLLVAEKLRRKHIGIEISKEYCDIAVERIKKETAQYKLSI